jgi:hypothetical protein
MSTQLTEWLATIASANTNKPTLDTHVMVRKDSLSKIILAAYKLGKEDAANENNN